jgi:hypothetical protein
VATQKATPKSTGEAPTESSAPTPQPAPPAPVAEDSGDRTQVLPPPRPPTAGTGDEPTQRWG